jgi:hypothetical protein
LFCGIQVVFSVLVTLRTAHYAPKSSKNPRAHVALKNARRFAKPWSFLQSPCMPTWRRSDSNWLVLFIARRKFGNFWTKQLKFVWMPSVEHWKWRHRAACVRLRWLISSIAVSTFWSILWYGELRARYSTLNFRVPGQVKAF